MSDHNHDQKHQQLRPDGAATETTLIHALTAHLAAITAPPGAIRLVATDATGQMSGAAVAPTPLEAVAQLARLVSQATACPPRKGPTVFAALATAQLGLSCEFALLGAAMALRPQLRQVLLLVGDAAPRPMLEPAEGWSLPPALA